MVASNTGNQFTSPAFFASQYQSLQSLLARVVQDSSTASDPDACMHYLQLTEILSSLLEECQLYSTLRVDALLEKEPAVGNFLTKLEALQSVVTDWGDCNVSGLKPASRKRGRTMSSAVDNSHSSRRRLERETEQALNMAPMFGGPFAEMIPLEAYEERDHPWWAEPYYD